MRPYIVYYRYKNPGEKKPGPVRQFRVYAADVADARRMAAKYANYPDIEVIQVRSA